MNKPIIITLSGKAQHGKDTSAVFLQKQFEKLGKKCLNIHYADYLKFICKQYYGWNGEKDLIGRTLLQKIGTEKVRTIDKTFWVDTVIRLVTVFGDDYDYVLIADTRFPDEIEKWKTCGFDVISIHVERLDYDNGLTEEQKRHPSETSLDNYKNWNYIVEAKDIEELNNKINIIGLDIVN